MAGGSFLAGDVVGTGIGLYQTFEGLDLLKKLEQQPVPEESISPELQNAYNKVNEYAGKGYTPEETAVFQTQTNRAANTAYNKGVALGGNSLGNVLQGTINTDELMSYDQFAAQSADIRRKSITDLASEADKIQEQKNRIQDQRLNHRMQLEQAYGGVVKSGLENIMKNFGVGGATGSLYDYAGGKKQQDDGTGDGNLWDFSHSPGWGASH